MTSLSKKSNFVTKYVPAINLTEVPAAHHPVDPDCDLLQPGDHVSLLLGVQEPGAGAGGLPQAVPVPLELVLVCPDVVPVQTNVLHRPQGGDLPWPQLHCAASHLATRDESDDINALERLIQ